MRYRGYLARTDPLYGYLRDDILPQVGFHGASADFRVFRLQASNPVYLYQHKDSHTYLIGKFFNGAAHRSPESSFHHMEREFNNLNHLRSIGFASHPHYIARPLGRNAGLNCILVQEFRHGVSLNDVILQAIRASARESLFQKLAALAYFLATLHNRTATAWRVDMNRDCAYFDRIMGQLQTRGHIGWGEAEDFHRLKDRWREKACMWEDHQVLVHGDVTPTNILFGDGLAVTAIDLERMTLADRVFDVGRVAAEIKHYFMQYAGDPWLAEPFIGHFLWEYAGHFPDRDSAFQSIVRRAPFHLGMTLLRIARNAWIADAYRRRLLDEARATLEVDRR